MAYTTAIRRFIVFRQIGVVSNTVISWSDNPRVSQFRFLHFQRVYSHPQREKCQRPLERKSRSERRKVTGIALQNRL
jgi:hypothetical protein